MEISQTIKNSLLETMDEFHRVCEENNLQYFLIGGSLIGALRHKGFIPWDDDIDIIMPKSDFNQLLLLSDNFKDNYCLQHRSLDSSYPEPFARIENNAIIIDMGYLSGFKNGVFVDVFNLEDTFSSKFFIRQHFRIVALFRNIIKLKTKNYRNEKVEKKITPLLNFISFLLSFFPMKLRQWLLGLSEKMGSISWNKKNIANLHGCWKTKEVAPKEIFNKSKLYEFEGRHYWSIADADAWLIPIYGNYMELPAIEERHPKHIDKIVSKNGVE